MINQLTMFSLYLAGVTTFVLPMVLILVGFIYKKLDVVRLLMGMFIFLVLNLFIMNPLLNFIAIMFQDNPLLAQAAFTVPLSVLLISLVAVYGRKFSFKYLMPNPHSEKEVLSIAVGLGTGEVIFSIGMMMISNLYYAIKINNGSIYNNLSIEDAEVIIKNAQAVTFDAILYYALTALAIIVVNVVITYMIVKAKNKNDSRYMLFALVVLLMFNVLIYILPMYNQFILSIITSCIYACMVAYLAYTKQIFTVEQH